MSEDRTAEILAKINGPLPQWEIDLDTFDESAEFAVWGTDSDWTWTLHTPPPQRR